MNHVVSAPADASPFMKWAPLILLCIIQMGATADSSVLITATSALLESMKTTVSYIQIANAIYPLVASSLMIICGFIGLIIGWRRVLRIGLLILACGEILAAFSPNMFIFTYVARVLTGIGASVAIPGMLGLIPGTYHGREQAIAFGAIAASNGLASAIGPVVGGAIIVGFGWQWAFVSLGLLFLLSLFASVIIKPLPVTEKRPHFDIVGAVLIIAAMFLVISGLLTINEWGFIKPVAPPFMVFDLSPSPFFIVLGLFIFWLFLHWQEHIENQGKMAFLPAIFLNNRQVRSGLFLMLLIFLSIGGFFFLIITYLQVVIGLDAVRSGFVLSVFALGMVLFAIGTPLLLKNASPRLICRLGIITLVLSCIIIAYGLESMAINPLLLLGLFFAGSGCGLVASQSSIVITSAIPEHYAQQSGGVQGTMRSLGQAVGVALSGVILITFLTAAVKTTAKVSPYISAAARHQVQLVSNVPFISNQQVETILKKAKLPDKQRQALIDLNEHSRLFAARITTLSIGLMAFLFLFTTKHLPRVPASPPRQPPKARK